MARDRLRCVEGSDEDVSASVFFGRRCLREVSTTRNLFDGLEEVSTTRNLFDGFPAPAICLSEGHLICGAVSLPDDGGIAQPLLQSA